MNCAMNRERETEIHLYLRPLTGTKDRGGGECGPGQAEGPGPQNPVRERAPPAQVSGGMREEAERQRDKEGLLTFDVSCLAPSSQVCAGCRAQVPAGAEQAG